MPVAVNNAFTVLALTGIGVSPYASRGLTQTLAPIQQAAQLRRTVNGDLKDLSFAGFRKYTSSISGSDMKPPVCDGIWPGKQVTVDCISQLSYITAGGAPERPVVPGSSYTDGLLTFYRPRLTMLVTSWSAQEDEYGATVGWTLNLEEV